MNRWTRRAVMQATLAGMAAAAVADTPPTDSLDALARKKGLRFGSSLGGRGLRDPNYLALIESQCGMLVPENELKMAFIQRTPGEFQFERAEVLLTFAEGRRLLMRGHTLLWHHPKWMPRWLDTYDF